MGIKQRVADYKNNLFNVEGLSFREQLGYAGGIFGNSMGQDCAEAYADKFERNFMGINAENMLLKSDLALAAGFVAPPLIGAWYDRPTRHGKEHNLSRALSIAQIPFAVASVLRFVVPFGSSSLNFVWALLFTLIFSISDNFFDMAMDVLALKVVHKPSDKKNFYTISSIASTLGAMLPSWVIPMVVGSTHDAKRQQLFYFLCAFVFAALAIMAMYAPYRTVCRRSNLILHHHQIHHSHEAGKVTWNKETVKLILHNRPFVVLQLSKFFDIFKSITYSMLPYLYDDTFDDYGMMTVIDVITRILSFGGVLSVPVVGKHVSARNMLSGGYMHSALFYGIVSLFNFKFSVGKVRKRKYLIGILLALSGLPNSAQNVARKIIMADSANYMEWYAQKNNISVLRCDGLLVASQSIISKLISIVKTNFYNALFLTIKYKENDLKTGIKPVQSDSTLRGIFGIVSLCGLIGNALAGIVVMFDNYTGERKKVIYQELTEMRAKRREALNGSDSTQASDESL